MFPYDNAILAALANPPQNIPDVLGAMQTIDGLCDPADGLKWFNWLYMTVTAAVEDRVSKGGFNDPKWLAELDVQFATLYFNALRGWLTDGQCPDCWGVMFAARANVKLARIQFAFAGMNAHINHDLCLAVDATCKVTGTVPQHGTPQYADYTGVNATLDGLTEEAKKGLSVRLPGDSIPELTALEDRIAGFDMAAARESAWRHAELLWELPQLLGDSLKLTMDGMTAVIGKALLIPV